jgi:rhodanese-related sulfurtransferase
MNASTDLPAIDVAAAWSMRNGVVLLDVRAEDEWTAGHAPGAVHIPLADLPARAGEIDGTRPIVCICRSGNRSARATAWLRARGVDAINMAGGMRAWADAGQPIIDDHGRSGTLR